MKYFLRENFDNFDGKAVKNAGALFQRGKVSKSVKFIYKSIFFKFSDRT